MTPNSELLTSATNCFLLGGGMMWKQFSRLPHLLRGQGFWFYSHWGKLYRLLAQTPFFVPSLPASLWIRCLLLMLLRIKFLTGIKPKSHRGPCQDRPRHQRRMKENSLAELKLVWCTQNKHK